MKELISEFADYLKYERNRSDRTVTVYSDDLRDFAAFVAEKDRELTWSTIDSDVVRSWLEEMMDKGNAASSVNRRLSSLHTFYRFALARNKVEKDPSHGVKGPKKAKPLPQYVNEAEMNRLLDADIWKDDFDGVRNKTVILTFYSTGMRLSELIGLTDSSIDYVQDQIKVLGKRNKERIIPFGKELKDALGNYQRVRNETFGEQDGLLFVNNKGARMTQSWVREMVKRHLSLVTTMKKRSPHVLRHSFATAMLNNESGLESVQKLLGHASLAATEIYTHTTFAQLKAAYGKAHPRGSDDRTESEIKSDK